MMRQMLRCHWSARRIQRYLDRDPAAPLTPGEVARLEEHLATCVKCSQVVREHRALHRALTLWSGRPDVDPASVARLRRFVDGLTEEPRG
ncbi:zf-HC2 domain-containing protein [Nocardioides sp. GCM10027113]|uniref:zf-HC2 domain-containing protein n=1 Tax=unclassified Nocardioides TaxID=2615069 RepID=UPI003623B7E4